MLLGLWTSFSPFVLGFRGVLPAAWNNVGVGILIAVFSGVRISLGYKQPVWSWCTAVFGLWLMISPFLLHFTHAPQAMWNDIVVGILTVFLSWRSTLESEPLNT